jgi:hypothetical protein
VIVTMLWETLGGWYEQTVEQVKKQASAQPRQTWGGSEQSEPTRHLYQKLSVLLAWPGEMQPSWLTGSQPLPAPHQTNNHQIIAIRITNDCSSQVSI